MVLRKRGLLMACHPVASPGIRQLPDTGRCDSRLAFARMVRTRATLVLLGLACLHCSGASDSGSCLDDSNGKAGGDYTFILTVDDSGFSKQILQTENLAQVTLTLTNMGTKPHGFEVACIETSAPAGCSRMACFPDGSTIAPLAPGASTTVTFDTPSPEGIYTFTSGAPGDGEVEGLNDGQFIVM
jgi:hypothetical protein